MLRASLLRRLSLYATTLPPHFTSSTDVAFYFPRFQPSTHLNSAGIPELQQALELLPSRSLSVPRKTADDTVEPLLSPKRATGGSNTGAGPCVVSRWTTAALGDTSKCLGLLDRGIEILESAGGLKSSATRALLKPLYATRFEMLFGTAHLPRPTHSPATSAGQSAAYRNGSLHVPRHILYHTSRLLVSAAGWEEDQSVKPTDIDTDCVILAHFVKSFCLLNTRPFHKAVTPSSSGPSAGIQRTDIKSKGGGSACYASPRSTWSLQVDGGKAVMTVKIALQRLDQLKKRVEVAMRQPETDGTDRDSWRFYIPKLLLLQATLTIAEDGHLLRAKKYVDEAAEMVYKLKQRKHILLDGLREGERPSEPELGLFLLAQAEIMARVWDWGNGKPGMLKTSGSATNPNTIVVGELDEDVFDAFESAAGFYAAPFSTTIKADGIMDLTLLPEREFEVHAYVVCILSLATVLMNAPRAARGATPGAAAPSAHAALSAVHQDTKPVFLPQQIFTLCSPLLTVQSPSDVIFADSARLRPISVEEARKTVGHLLERALQLTRALYPEQKDHPLAAQILTVMACLYADTRDYLYASGLFESARKSVAAQFGGVLSHEGVFVEKLRYEFLAGVGSAEEAKTAAHEIVHHLKQMDSLPVI